MYFNFRAPRSVLAAAFLLVFFVLSLAAYSGARQTSAAVSNGKKDVAVPVIMYHSLLKDEALQGKYVISPELFKSDVKELKSRGYSIIGSQELLDYVNGKIVLPDKCVVLTFDDGYYNNYIYAYQTAVDENIKFILSPVASEVEKSSGEEHLSPSYSACTRAQIREMVQSGHVEIFSHSYDMHDTSARRGTKIIPGENAQEYKQLLKDDLSRAQELFKEETGSAPVGFTYPFGEVCDEANRIIREMGFKLSFTCEEKTNTVTPGNPDCLYNMGRYLRNNTDSSKEFLDKILP